MKIHNTEYTFVIYILYIMQKDHKMHHGESVSPRVNDGCQSKTVPVKTQRESGDEKPKKTEAQGEASASFSGWLMFDKWKRFVVVVE